MRTKKPLATENDIDGISPEKCCKLNFGGGLHLLVQKGGHKYFQFRFCLDGKGKTVQLGKYPEMKLAQAQEKANHFRAQVTKVRSKKAELDFQVMLKRQGNRIHTERYGVFKNIPDAAKFIHNLRETSWDTEIGRALYLQLLIPSRLKEIICAQLPDFKRLTAEWWISQKRAGGGNFGATHSSIAYLSQHATSALGELPPSTNNDPYLFPTLARMSKSEREKTVCEVMRVAWPDYPVDPEGIQPFFKAMANQHSYFRPELIEDMVSHKSVHRAGVGMSSYIFHRKALAEWWGSVLLIPSD